MPKISLRQDFPYFLIWMLSFKMLTLSNDFHNSFIVLYGTVCFEEKQPKIDLLVEAEWKLEAHRYSWGAVSP